LDPRAHNNEEKRIPQYKKNKEEEEEAIPATASKQAHPITKEEIN